MGRTSWTITFGLIWSQVLIAQADRTFPNVNATTTTGWSCIDPTNGPWTMWWNETYEAQPAIQHEGLDWGEFGPGNGWLAVSGQQVLFWSNGWLLPQDSIEVLYDFGLIIGDTAYYDSYYAFGITTVVATDTVDFDGRSRKRMYLSNDDVWVEGIGSLQGILRPLWETPLGCVSPIYTFCGNYIDSALVSYQICADILLPVDEVLVSVDLMVFPNPSQGVFAITGTKAGGEFALYDVAGRTVATGTTSEDRTNLDLHHVVPGTYCLRIGSQGTMLIME